jgi:hypothetical protein
VITSIKFRLALVLILGTFVLNLRTVAQTTILLPPPRIQFLDNNGKPLAGGFVFTYLAGTSIQQATYTDSTGATLNPDPVVLDAGGFASIYLTNATSYRFVVQNSLGVQQYVADNVRLVSSAQVGGSNTQVQYNCTGTFCGSSGMTYNSGTQTLTVTSIAVSSGGSLSGTFSGNPTFSGTVNFSGSVTFATFNVATLGSTNCGSIASTGFIRMCQTDVINWRNSTNSGDEGISTDASDRFNISHTNGILLTGTTPNVRLGGTSASFPMWKRITTELAARLADDSGSAPVSASTLTFNGPVGTGVTISGPCSTGQVLTASSATAMGCGAGPSAVLLHATVASYSNTTIGNVNTTIFSRNITMPASGCPCRVFASYFILSSTGASGIQQTYIFDGTNAWGGAEQLVTGGASNFGQWGSGSSPGTYSNGANVTFTVIGASTAAGSWSLVTSGGTAITGFPTPALTLDVFGSN